MEEGEEKKEEEWVEVEEEKEEKEEKRESCDMGVSKSKMKKGERKEVFRRKTIVKEGKKNTNLPKFFVRILMKYYR